MSSMEHRMVGSHTARATLVAAAPSPDNLLVCLARKQQRPWLIAPQALVFAACLASHIVPTWTAQRLLRQGAAAAQLPLDLCLQHV